jgi:hypothetical protein
MDSYSNKRECMFSFYLILVVLCRGIFFPDFSYNIVSIIVIQVIFPLLVCFLVFLQKSIGYVKKVFLSFLAILVSEMISLGNYWFTSGLSELTSDVSVTIFLGSFLAQIFAIIIFAFLYKVLQKIHMIS